MSEVLRDLVVSLSLDGDNFSRNLTSINKQIQEAESEFRRAASGVDNFEKSVSGTQNQLSSLLLSPLLWLQESRRRLARHYSGRSRKCAADLQTLSVREKHCGDHARAGAAKYLIPDRQGHMESKGNRYAAQQREVSRQFNSLNCPYEQ